MISGEYLITKFHLKARINAIRLIWLKEEKKMIY